MGIYERETVRVERVLTVTITIMDARMVLSELVHYNTMRASDVKLNIRIPQYTCLHYRQLIIHAREGFLINHLI